MIRPSRLAMIGLDAAELTFIREHAAALPVLTQLFAQAQPRVIGSTASVLAGSVWPTFYTGTMPGEHGIYHHLQWDPARMKLRRVRADWLWAEPFWYELERRGQDVIALDVPMTFPSRLSRGAEIINWGSHDTLSATSAKPAGLKRQILRRFGRHPMGCEIPVNKTADELERIRVNLVAGARRKGELSRWLAESRPWDFFVTIFGETHRGGHILWPESDGSGDRTVPPTALLDVYKAVDDAIGHLLDTPAMRDATVVLFALHGMGPNISQEHFVPKIVDRLNARFAGAATGTAPANGDGTPAATPPAGQRSLMRMLREKLPAGLQNAIARAVPVGVRDYVVNKSVTSGHDWAHTPGLALLADLHGYFRFNLAGREKSGSLAPGGEEHERYREFVREAFASFHVSGTDKPLVRETLFTADAFPGRRQHLLPDVILSWHVAPQARAIESPLLGAIHSDPGTGRSGNHRPEGFVAVVQQGLAPFDESRVDHIADLAGAAINGASGRVA